MMSFQALVQVEDTASIHLPCMPLGLFAHFHPLAPYLATIKGLATKEGVQLTECPFEEGEASAFQFANALRGLWQKLRALTVEPMTTDQARQHFLRLVHEISAAQRVPLQLELLSDDSLGNYRAFKDALTQGEVEAPAHCAPLSRFLARSLYTGAYLSNSFDALLRHRLATLIKRLFTAPEVSNATSSAIELQSWLWWLTRNDNNDLINWFESLRDVNKLTYEESAFILQEVISYMVEILANAQLPISYALFVEQLITRLNLVPENNTLTDIQIQVIKNFIARIQSPIKPQEDIPVEVPPKIEDVLPTTKEPQSKPVTPHKIVKKSTTYSSKQPSATNWLSALSLPTFLGLPAVASLSFVLLKPYALTQMVQGLPVNMVQAAQILQALLSGSTWLSKLVFTGGVTLDALIVATSVVLSAFNLSKAQVPVKVTRNVSIPQKVNSPMMKLLITPALQAGPALAAENLSSNSTQPTRTQSAANYRNMFTHSPATNTESTKAIVSTSKV